MLTIQITTTILPSQCILLHPRRKDISSCHGDNGFARFLLVPSTHVVNVAALCLFVCICSVAVLFLLE
ncbi:MAG: hypothetical protein BYD32DRAFT_427586 [Podila humilis]|nr:MAG: hypothetical protein BYD32DRAFT_427586 [Podila humilis]